eukprot:163546-Chlamydomonas_euryale.AAC.2
MGSGSHYPLGEQPHVDAPAAAAAHAWLQVKTRSRRAAGCHHAHLPKWDHLRCGARAAQEHRERRRRQRHAAERATPRGSIAGPCAAAAAVGGLSWRGRRHGAHARKREHVCLVPCQRAQRDRALALCLAKRQDHDLRGRATQCATRR